MKLRARQTTVRRGAALVEVALCLALFTPLVFAGLRLARGTNQMHDLADAVSAAARAGGACAPEADIRRVAVSHVAGLNPADVAIAIQHSGDQAFIRVSIENFRVIRLLGAEQLQQAPSATFPYTCD